MTMDQRNHHLGSSLAFDHMPYGHSPHFTNPWSSASPAHPQLFPNSNSTGFDALAKQQNARTSTASVPYSSVPASAPSMGPSTYSYGSSSLLDMSQDLLHQRPTYEHGYSAAPTSVSSYASTSAPFVSNYENIASSQQSDEVRRLSHSLVSPIILIMKAFN